MKSNLWRVCLLWIFLNFGTSVFAQQPAISEATAKGYFYKSLGWRYSKLDSCYVLAQKIETAAKQLQSSRLTAYKKGILAIYYLEKFKLSEAEKNALQSEQIFKRHKLLKETALMQSVLGRINQNKSDYVKASEYYFTSNKIADQIDYDYVKILNNKNLSFVFLDQNDFKKAYFYILEANKLALKIQDKTELGFTEGVLAEVYRTDKKIEKANIHFEKAYHYFETAQLDFGKAWTLTNWSLVFGSDMEKSHKMQVRAQKIWNVIAPNNVMSIANQYNIGYNFLDLYRYGNHLKHLKNFNVSKEKLLDSCSFYINKCLRLAKVENNVQWQMFSYGTLNSIYYYKRDFLAYVDCNESYHKLKDSIYSQENKNKIASLEVAKEIELKNKEIELNRIAIENKERQKWYLLASILLLGVIGGLLFYQNRSRKKTNQKLQLLNDELDAANKTKTRFFSILNHDLRSPVSNLIHFLHLQKENPELLDEESKKRLENKTILGAENLLNSMEDILLWSKGQMENFAPKMNKVAVNSLFEDTRKHFSSEEKVNITFENPQNIELNTDENYLKTIIRNLTGNAIKALDKTEHPTIHWKAWQEKNQTFLSITDNGSGGTQEQFKALYDETEVVGIQTGLGLHLIRDLAKAIDCSIAVNSTPNHGTTFVLSFI